jgi:hypothetical protein
VKKSFCLIVILCGYLCNALAQNNNILDVDFMQSMTDGSQKANSILTADPKYAHYLEVLRDNYEAKKPSKMPYNEAPLIPKVMHHIWIGGGEIPPLYQNYLNECKKLHPNWEFKIWGDKEIVALNLEYEDVMDQMRNYPGKTDILRYEILYRFGGVYKDLDVKCYRPLDDLNHKYEFYVPLEYPIKMWKKAVINNGIIAASPGHKILKFTLDSIKSHVDEKWDNFDYDSDNSSEVAMTVIATSLMPLTDEFINNLSADDRNIAFPATYFFPLAYNYLYEKNFFSKWLHKRIVKTPEQMYFQFIKPETLMWHNFMKNEIKSADFDGANGMSDPARKRLFAKLPHISKKSYQVFGDIYNSNNVTKVGWSKKSKTPQVINFVVFNDDEMLELNKHLPNWRMFNGDFEINVWDKAKIASAFPDLINISTENFGENIRFYVGLKILEKFGGTYANFKATPHASIFELNNKYNFYAGLMPIDQSASYIALSQRLIGASHDHPIVSNTLRHIDLNDKNTLDKINETFVLEAYKNMYLNGKNIVLPAIYFEPIDKLEDDYLYMVPDYAIRFFKNISKSFTEVTGYSVIE